MLAHGAPLAPEQNYGRLGPAVPLWSLSEAPPNALPRPLPPRPSSPRPSSPRPSSPRPSRFRELEVSPETAEEALRAVDVLTAFSNQYGLQPPVHAVAASGARGCSLRCTRLQVLFAFSTCFDDVDLADMLAAGLRPGARVVTVDSMLPNR